MPFIGGSGSNPLILIQGTVGALLGLPSGATTLKAPNLRIEATVAAHNRRAPTLTLTYSGTGNAQHVYARVVDDETGLVLCNQVTAIPVTLDGQTHTVTCDLEQVAYTLQAGQSLTVQVRTSAFPFISVYSWGAITVVDIEVSLPMLDTATGAVAGSA
ncbi:hypothetical protein JDV09_10820 [Mycobacterium sp. Y57]|uniref:hypothetical protein n=1 Tax=Mycolicibacterium xanthum TaxID=2796469 RepID=UPI001C840D49|nr:hypothetical protein [Mycolicibacterium xanthum]MBX7432591.1 hypothetical protein [Mycolicibacterium xanthum]